MANSYGAIPQDPDASSASAKRESSFNHKPLIVLGITLVAGLGLIIRSGYFFDSAGTSPPPDALTDSIVAPTDPAKHWPAGLFKIGGILPSVAPPMPAPQEIPTDTINAATKGWVKIDKPCNPLLGEEWLYGGERSLNISASVYFTPEVGDVAGVLSAIEVQYYGYIEENLVGTYFSEAKPSKDGWYHTLPIALRDGKAEDLCDTDTPVTPENSPYMVISPGMANKIVPPTKDSPELISDWKEGACIQGMGFHWATDVETGPNLTYKAENMVPIVPMYSSVDRTINGIFFMATSRKQNWPEGCPGKPFAPCAAPGLNMWDGSPGLTQVNAPHFYMCSNFCGDCQFTGAEDGMFTTMHWFFKNTFSGPDQEKCDGSNGYNPYCRSGKYPAMVASP